MNNLIHLSQTMRAEGVSLRDAARPFAEHFCLAGLRFLRRLFLLIFLSCCVSFFVTCRLMHLGIAIALLSGARGFFLMDLLLVEDNPTDRMVIQARLQHAFPSAQILAADDPLPIQRASEARRLRHRRH